MSVSPSMPGKGYRLSLRQAGFTLVELMIVVAVIGLLAGIAVPSYREQVNKGKRSEGKAALLAAATRMERYYSQNNCYPSPAPCGNPTPSGNVATALTNVGVSATSGDDPNKAYYTIDVTLTPQAYTLRAIPRLPFVDPKCGALTLTNTGRKWTQINMTSDDAVRGEGCW